MANISIKDLAKIAGVSHSTVSRALRNHPLIPSETRERIQHIARREGYSVSAVARSLATRKTHTLGVVVTSLSDPFHAEVVAGIEDVANAAGYSVLLATSQADPERELSVVRSFEERRVDGILVASSRVGSLYARNVSQTRVPMVLLNNQQRGVFLHSVSIDNVHGAELATNHLIALGHTRIAYIGDRFGLQSDRERARGFKTAMRKAGLESLPEYCVAGDGKPERALEAAAQLLDLAHPPTAIFCYNDMSALGVFSEAQNREMNIPGDLSVCGFDNLFLSRFLCPALTTIHQPKAEIGRRATEIMIRLLEGEQERHSVKMKGELLIRQSTAPPRP